MLLNGEILSRGYGRIMGPASRHGSKATGEFSRRITKPRHKVAKNKKVERTNVVNCST